MLDMDVFFFCALPIDQSKIKHTKKLKEIPSRHFLENLPEKASMYAFIHLKLIGNLQGLCQYIMADMLNLSTFQYSDNRKKIRDHKRKILQNDYDFWHFSIHTWYMRVCEKMSKVIII